MEINDLKEKLRNERNEKDTLSMTHDSAKREIASLKKNLETNKVKYKEKSHNLK